MSNGHKHRIIRLRQGTVLYRVLRKPLVRTADIDRAERSRWQWGLGGFERVAGDGPARFVQVYTLSLLGVLHTLTGLTIEVES